MNTIDILSIHDIIVREHRKEINIKNPNSEEHLDESMEKWKELYQQISQNNTSTDVLTDVKAKFVQDEKQKNENFNFYLIAVVSLLEEFMKYRSQIQKVSFFRSMNDSIYESKKAIEDVVNRYIGIVENYFPEKYSDYWNIDTDRLQKRKKIKMNCVKECPTCNIPNTEFVLSDNHLVCSQCGTVISITNDNLISFRDIERINIGSKYTYDRKTHFRECLKRFQGKQNVNIPSKLFEDVTDQLIRYGLIPPDYKNYEKKEVFQDVKREHIQMILKDLSYS